MRDLVTSDLKPVYVGLVLVDNARKGRLRRLIDETGSAPMESAHETYDLDSGWPTARAAKENRTIVVTDEAELRRDYAPEAVAAFHSLGLSSAVCVPLPGTVIPLGTLVLGWDEAHEVDIVEQALLAVSIGDITGHDLRAATLMGQVRSMLRQADLDHPGAGPARALAAFEHANTRLDIGASGTLIHAHLRPCPAPQESSWELTWTNAGHPPPLTL
ncbi:SpoIIE family protein phosphatase [Streptomyces cyaneofuscatus]|uniref:SpoIIE family protein phosphatase n=1 Tax=Streptomyces cyaneofuscatus TaxID=66883 RepID=UPI002955C005|nr:SpoIIE family protein phosphatase [Streptomyces cyaneofuscatus]WOP13319.1 SpoIIE family protein phosphatase [Streptomyces cyaneofuscatus]